MRPITVGVAVLLTALAGARGPLAADTPGASNQMENTLTPEQRAEGWTLLFDGRSTAGWRGFKKKDVPAGWQVVDGALTRVGAGGDLITVDQFASFDLVFDWQLSKGGNSGVMYRVSEDAEETYHTGPEFQILDNTAHRDGRSPLTSTGACYGLYPPVKDVTRPVGEWNSARILVDANRVEHWLNGVRIVEYDLASDEWAARVKASKFNEWQTFGRMGRGHLAFQDHGDRVAYRNIRIRPIGPTTGQRPPSAR